MTTHFLVFVISKLKHKDETKSYLLKNYEKHLKVKPKNTSSPAIQLQSAD